MISSAVEVLRHRQPLGYLHPGVGAAQWAFTYHDDSFVNSASRLPFSVTFPSDDRTLTSPLLQSWFENLLPDLEIRAGLCRRLGISLQNSLKLLALQGGDCFGALSFRLPEMSAQHEEELRALTPVELRNLSAALTTSPFLIGVEGARFLLPGTGVKLPVRYRDDQVLLPLGNALSSHLWIPADPKAPDSAVNEAFCMALAALCGLPVVPSTFHRAAVSAVIRARIDRAMTNDGQVTALHVEDFCQLGGLESAQKYERDGACNLAAVAELVRTYSAAPALDVRTLIDWVLLVFFIGYGSGHLKHLAMRQERAGLRLAPFSGLSCTHLYTHLSDRLALSVGGEDRPNWLTMSRWLRCAEHLGVRPKYLLQRLAAIAELIETNLAVATERVPMIPQTEACIGAIKELIRTRITQTKVSLAAEYPHIALKHGSSAKFPDITRDRSNVPT